MQILLEEPPARSAQAKLQHMQFMQCLFVVCACMKGGMATEDDSSVRPPHEACLIHGCRLYPGLSS
jgi:hypothetical protein